MKLVVTRPNQLRAVQPNKLSIIAPNKIRWIEEVLSGGGLNWILRTGFWADSGEWFDIAFWID